MNVLSNPDTVAQEAHIGWGALVVLAVALFTNDLMLSAWSAIWFAYVKEILEAAGWAFWELKQTWRSSLRDFEFWLIGIAFGSVLVALAKI
jgi:hypothetical protein